MKKVIGFTSLFTIGVLVISGCASNVPERENFTYTIADASLDKRPEWLENLSVLSNGDDEYKYFIGDFENINKTLCQKGAEARASEKVVSDIKQKIRSRFVDDVVNVNGEVDQQTGAALEKNLNSKLGGIETVRSYWELKNFKVKMGAEEDSQVYSCHAVVKVKKATLDNFANNFNENNIKKQNAKTSAKIKSIKRKGAEKVSAANKKMANLDDQMKKEFVDGLNNN